MRPGKPWYWRARDAWYTELGGRRIRLAKGRTAKAEAMAAFGRLLASGSTGSVPTGSPAPVPLAGDATVGKLAAAYVRHLAELRDRGERAPGVVTDWVRRAGRFVDAFESRAAATLTPGEVEDWIGRQRGANGGPRVGPRYVAGDRGDERPWGPTTRNATAGAIRSMLRWAVRRGWLDRDPLAGLAMPRRRLRREVVLSPEEARRVLNAIRSEPIRDLFTFLYLTGCRPIEARIIEARHLDFAAGIARLAQHKTARSSGRDRVIVLPAAAVAIARRAAAAYPSGPIFRNARGAPWTKDAINCAVRRIRRAAGVGVGFSANALRHLFLTDFLAQTGDLAVAAELAGHTSPAMVGQVYSRLGDRIAVLRAKAEAVRGSDTAFDGRSV
jgi:integrase